MRLSDQFKFALRALMGRKLRSGLTLLGIVVGVVLLVAVFVVADSVTASVEQTLLKGGANQVYVIAGERYLTDSDRSLLESIPHVTATISYFYYEPVTVSFGGASETAAAVFVEPEGLLSLYPGLEAEEGVVEITPSECLVGGRLAEELGGMVKSGDLIQVSAMGKTTSLRVAGVLKRYGFTFAGWVDMSVIASIDVVQRQGALKYYPYVLVIVDRPDNVEVVVDLIKDLYSGSVSLFVIKDIVRQIMNAMESTTLIIGGVAAVTLVVAAVGLMNAMFTAVAERTRIIGVLRALGVKKRDVMFLFLIEALALTSIGLAIGLPLGLTIGALLVSYGGFSPSPAGRVMELPITIELSHLLLVILVPLLLSLIGALPPAYRASSLEPAQALRQE